MKLKKIEMHSVLKLIAIIGLFCTLYPLIAACMILSSGELQNFKSVLLLLMNMVFGAFGILLQMGLHYLENRKKLSVVARKLIITAFIPIIVVKIFLFFSLEQLAVKIFLSLIFIAAYLMGAWCYSEPYKNILSTNIISISAGANFAVIFILWLLGKERVFSYSLSLFTAIFFIEILIFAITRNQGNIDYLMERRQHKLSHLPRKIRYYNLLLLSVLAALTGFFYLFRGQIIWVMKKILLGIRSGIIMFIEFLRYLAELLSSDGELGSEAAPPPDNAAVAGADANNTSLGWIVILVLIIVIIVKRKAILSWIASKLRRLAGIIKKFFLRSDTIKRYDDSSEYYHDKVEDIAVEQREKSRKSSEKATMRMLKKEYKAYRKMAVSEQKLRQGYKLLRAWLLMSGVKITPADTTLEVLQKQGQMLDPKVLCVATVCYNELEYGEKAFTEKAFFEVDSSVKLAFEN